MLKHMCTPGMEPSTLVLVLKYYKYSYESTCTYLSFISTQYLYSSTELCIYKYLNTCKFFEVPLSSFIIWLNKVNLTQVHVEGSFKPHSKKGETLFSFMPDPETEATPFQSHSNTDDYIAAPRVFMDTNPAKY